MQVPVVGLLGRHGERRALQLEVEPIEFGADPWGPSVEELVGPVRLELTLESVVDGILVRGTIAADARASCARCLTTMIVPRTAEVTELHRVHRPTTSGPADPVRAGSGQRRERPSAQPRASRGPRAEDDWDEVSDEVDDFDYELVAGNMALELDQMVRDALVIDQPVRVLCRVDCAGLCPTCGVDRNLQACTHGLEPATDPRWEALRGLTLPGPEERPPVGP
jgi:uncharacterized protein